MEIEKQDDRMQWSRIWEDYGSVTVNVDLDEVDSWISRLRVVSEQAKKRRFLWQKWVSSFELFFHSKRDHHACMASHFGNTCRRQSR